MLENPHIQKLSLNKVEFDEESIELLYQLSNRSIKWNETSVTNLEKSESQFALKDDEIEMVVMNDQLKKIISFTLLIYFLFKLEIHRLLPEYYDDFLSRLKKIFRIAFKENKLFIMAGILKVNLLRDIKIDGEPLFIAATKLDNVQLVEMLLKHVCYYFNPNEAIDIVINRGNVAILDLLLKKRDKESNLLSSFEYRKYYTSEGRNQSQIKTLLGEAFKYKQDQVIEYLLTYFIGTISDNNNYEHLLKREYERAYELDCSSPDRKREFLDLFTRLMDSSFGINLAWYLNNPQSYNFKGINFLGAHYDGKRITKDYLIKKGFAVNKAIFNLNDLFALKNKEKRARIIKYTKLHLRRLEGADEAEKKFMNDLWPDIFDYFSNQKRNRKRTEAFFIRNNWPSIKEILQLTQENTNAEITTSICSLDTAKSTPTQTAPQSFLLHKAIEKKSYTFLKTLIANDSWDINASNDTGLTPLSLAKKLGDQKAFNIIMNAQPALAFLLKKIKLFHGRGAVTCDFQGQNLKLPAGLAEMVAIYNKYIAESKEKAILPECMLIAKARKTSWEKAIFAWPLSLDKTKKDELELYNWLIDQMPFCSAEKMGHGRGTESEKKQDLEKFYLHT